MLAYGDAVAWVGKCPGTLLGLLKNSKLKKACSHLELYYFVHGLLVASFYSLLLPARSFHRVLLVPLDNTDDTGLSIFLKK